MVGWAIAARVYYQACGVVRHPRHSLSLISRRQCFLWSSESLEKFFQWFRCGGGMRVVGGYSSRPFGVYQFVCCSSHFGVFCKCIWFLQISA